MSESSAKALQGLYKKMTNKDAKGKTKVQCLNEIAASMGATKKSETTAKCIDDITANYTPGGGGGGGSSDFSTATVTFVADSTDPDGGGYLTNTSIIHEGQLEGSSSITFDIEQAELVLYKGSFVCVAEAMGLSASGDIELSNIEVIDGWTRADCVITGDCTIHYVSVAFI